MTLEELKLYSEEGFGDDEEETDDMSGMPEMDGGDDDEVETPEGDELGNW